MWFFQWLLLIFSPWSHIMSPGSSLTRYLDASPTTEVVKVSTLTAKTHTIRETVFATQTVGVPITAVDHSLLSTPLAPADPSQLYPHKNSTISDRVGTFQTVVILVLQGCSSMSYSLAIPRFSILDLVRDTIVNIVFPIWFLFRCPFDDHMTWMRGFATHLRTQTVYDAHDRVLAVYMHYQAELDCLIFEHGHLGVLFGFILWHHEFCKFKTLVGCLVVYAVITSWLLKWRQLYQGISRTRSRMVDSSTLAVAIGRGLLVQWYLSRPSKRRVDEIFAQHPMSRITILECLFPDMYCLWQNNSQDRPQTYAQNNQQNSPANPQNPQANPQTQQSNPQTQQNNPPNPQTNPQGQPNSPNQQTNPEISEIFKALCDDDLTYFLWSLLIVMIKIRIHSLKLILPRAKEIIKVTQVAFGFDADGQSWVIWMNCYKTIMNFIRRIAVGILETCAKVWEFFKLHVLGMTRHYAIFLEDIGLRRDWARPLGCSERVWNAHIETASYDWYETAQLLLRFRTAQRMLEEADRNGKVHIEREDPVSSRELGMKCVAYRLTLLELVKDINYLRLLICSMLNANHNRILNIRPNSPDAMHPYKASLVEFHPGPDPTTGLCIAYQQHTLQRDSKVGREYLETLDKFVRDIQRDPRRVEAIVSERLLSLARSLPPSFDPFIRQPWVFAGGFPGMSIPTYFDFQNPFDYRRKRVRPIINPIKVFGPQIEDFAERGDLETWRDVAKNPPPPNKDTWRIRRADTVPMPQRPYQLPTRFA